MKWIDDKGRIFGTINYVDLLIVVMLAILAVGGVTLLRRGATNLIPSPTAVNQQDIHITFFIGGVRNVTVNAIQEGDLLRNSETKKTLGTVVEKSYQNARIMTTDGEGRVVYAEVPDRYDILVKIVATGVVTDADVRVSNDPIKIGESIILESRMLRTTGIVFGIEPQ